MENINWDEFDDLDFEKCESYWELTEETNQYWEEWEKWFHENYHDLNLSPTLSRDEIIEIIAYDKWENGDED